MNVEVNMINVEDGDSIIISISKSKEEKYVIVIDGGKQNDLYFKRITNRLDEVLENKKAPDLIVCTHYDYDHIGGLIWLFEKYGNDIGEFWYHRPLDSFFEEIDNFISIDFSKRIGNFKNYKILESVRNNVYLKSYYYDILENINHLRKLEDVLRKVNFDSSKIKLPVRGLSFKLFNDFKVIGPSEQYYNSLNPAKSGLHPCILNELYQFYTKPKDLKLMQILEELMEKKTLAKTSKISNANKASVICHLKIGNDKYLFTGDAGIESLNDIPHNELQNLYFLDLPHHGRWNNISGELIDLMSPRYSFISGSNKDDDPDENVLNYLTKKTFNKPVHITNDPQNTWYIAISGNGFVRKYDK